MFLGVRLQCAKCHHHPFERSARTTTTAWPRSSPASAPRRARSSACSAASRWSSSTGRRRGRPPAAPARSLPPTPLDGKPVDDAARPPPGPGRLADRARTTRSSPATSSTATAATCMGRGLVEPIDDLRATNPADATPSCSTPWPTTSSRAASTQAAAADDHDVAAVPARLAADARRTRPTASSTATTWSSASRAEPLLDAIDTATGHADQVREPAAGHAGHRAARRPVRRTTS